MGSLHLMSDPTLEPDTGLVELRPGCWGWRTAFADLTLGVVTGRDGAVVVDTGPTEAHATAFADAIEARGLGPVVAVVNTHVHWDHVLGNAVFADRWPDAVVLAQENAAAATIAHVEEFRRTLAEPGSPYAASEHLDGLRTARVRPATDMLSSARVLDLGDRYVEVIHPGPAHTDGDVVVHVPDAALAFVGDLVEESAPPSYGEDSFPLTWHTALDLVVQMLPEHAVVVPGHGAPVGRAFVEEQRGGIGVVATTISDLAGRGISPGDALGASTWPFPVEALEHAVRRGYAHLPRGARQLPLA